MVEKIKQAVSAAAGAKLPSLREYMLSHPDGICANDAVSLLMPVALKLRDLHNGGKTHLQVSPDTITVGANGAKLSAATNSEAARYSSGFAAPEIYKGEAEDKLCDVYSFCAVLSFVLSGRCPENSLTRAEKLSGGKDMQVLPGFEDKTLSGVLNKGMSIQAPERFQSVQEIILKLSPYNIKPFSDSKPSSAVNNSTAAEKTRNINPKPIALAAAAAVLLIFIVIYIGSVSSARSCAKNGEFARAEDKLFLPQLTRVHNPKLIRYIDAGQLLSDGEYEKSRKIFSDLSGYMDADTLAMEAQYGLALEYAEANDFESAIEIMSALSEDGYGDAQTKLLDLQYKNGIYMVAESSDYEGAMEIFSSLAQQEYEDSGDMLRETRYLNGVHLLLDEQDYAAALDIFTELKEEGHPKAEEKINQTKYLIALDYVEDEDLLTAYDKLKEIRNFSDANETLSVITGAIYDQARQMYYNGNYTSASEYFRHISPYESSDKYLTLIRARGPYLLYTRANAVKDLKNIFYFEDASDLLVSETLIACEFLTGSWRTSNKSNYFVMEKTGEEDYFNNSYNIPWFGNGGTFYIEDGVYYVTGDAYTDKAQFKFTLLSPDSMEVYSFRNLETYTLYRQA